jgi:hypothetical protein
LTNWYVLFPSSGKQDFRRNNSVRPLREAVLKAGISISRGLAE